MTGFIFAYITFESQEQAENIGFHLVNEGLAACVNLFPGVTSLYKWEGELNKVTEIVGFVKTKASKFTALEKRVKELHSYETPCVVSIEIGAGNAEYLKWVEGELL